ncbi:MAG: hypothetical protein LM582_09115 [Desulfurococcaceae archaeon]|jgi:hypothetical protein|nr:hypothetical protein [Desulfurococcaceae archaeon]
MKCSGFVLLKVLDSTPRNIKSRIYKAMNGTTVTIKGRRYRSKGLLYVAKGVKIANTLYAIPYEETSSVLDTLREKNLLNYIQILNLCTCTCD